MNPISWISFIFVALQVLAMHRVAAPQPEGINGDNEPIQKELKKQPDTVSPLVMLIYFIVDQHYQTTYTDLETAKKMDLKLPLNNAEPRFIVLLCAAPDEEGNDNDVFIVRDIVRKIEPSTEYACQHYAKPTLRKRFKDSPYQFIFNYKMTAEQRQIASESFTNEHNTVDKSLIDLYSEFMIKYEIDTADSLEEEMYFSIHYDFERLVPETAGYIVMGRMRSDDDVKCHDMALGMETFTERNADFDFSKFSTEPTDYGWRQLIPARDFKGKYATAATCTYLNYALMHNDVVENWQRLETSIREAADVLDRVLVINGTYVEKTEAQIAPAIPTLLWKMLLHVAPGDEKFVVLIVVHNKKFERVCNHGKTDQGWGWPEHNYDDGRAGTMYYCRIEKAVVETLSLPTFQTDNIDEMEPFDLRKVTVDIDVLERIRRMENAVRDS